MREQAARFFHLVDCAMNYFVRHGKLKQPRTLVTG
jgi:hypothetical protein